MPLRGSAPDEDPWYLDWVLKHPNNISRSITAGWHAYRSLTDVYAPDEIASAIEYFGGVGAQSLIIQDLFAPTQHVVADYAAGSVEHMKAVLPEPIWVVQGDAYADDALAPNADLIGLDFGDLTAWRTNDGKKHRRLLDKVFACQPKGVVLTDIAGPRLGLQRDRYETLLGEGTCSSYETYLDAFVRRLEGLYNYRLQAGYYYRSVAKMAFVPAGREVRIDPALPPIYPIPDSPVGLELL